MKFSLIFIVTCCIGTASRAQKVITLKPNGEVKEFSGGELKQHMDLNTEGNRMLFNDSGQIICEIYFKHSRMNGYYKKYKNGILVELGLYKDDVRVGTHYFWDEKGILKKSIAYKDGKEIEVKQY